MIVTTENGPDMDLALPDRPARPALVCQPPFRPARHAHVHIKGADPLGKRSRRRSSSTRTAARSGRGWCPRLASARLSSANSQLAIMQLILPASMVWHVAVTSFPSNFPPVGSRVLLISLDRTPAEPPRQVCGEATVVSSSMTRQMMLGGRTPHPPLRT